MKFSKIIEKRLLYLYFLATIIIIDPCSSDKGKNVLTKLKKSPKSAKPSIFEPIKMDFPDTLRTEQEEIDYVKKLTEKLPARAIDSNLIVTGEVCARGLGVIYICLKSGDSDDSGKRDAKQKKRKTLYAICFNEKTGSPIYSTHELDIVDKILEHSKHRRFKPRYTLYNENVNGYYEAKEHTEVFNMIFHVPFTNEEIRLRYFFARNHLTPHADFALIVDQKLTYFFHNCIPGYQSVNADNIGQVEVVVRQLSIRLGVRLIIYTGVYGILKKWNKGKTALLDVYLDMDGKRFPVPRVIWKLAYNEETEESVSFFTSNDVNLTEDEIKHFRTICESDKCEELGFKFKTNPVSGITVCCTYQEFVRHINFLPVKLPKNSGLLGGKRKATSKKITKPTQTMTKAQNTVKELISKATKLAISTVQPDNVISTVQTRSMTKAAGINVP